MNVTELDLSDNLLDLTHSDSFKRLNLFSHLLKLNLSGNYLPLLLKEHLYSLSSLEVLDLSRCKLAAVEANALTRLSSIQMLFLGNIPSAAVQELRMNQFVQLGGELNNRQEVGNRVMMIRHSKHMTQDYHNDGMKTMVLYLFCSLLGSVTYIVKFLFLINILFDFMLVTYAIFKKRFI